MDNEELKPALLDVLQAGLNSFDMDLPEKAKQQLVDYVLLLHKWNKTQNLTSLHHPKAMMKRHVLDSLAIVPHIAASRCLDVGSGAGLPGIPLAVACSDKHIFLLEARLKRVIFLRHCVAALKISNAQVIPARLEKHYPDHPYDGVVARAFCAPETFLSRVAHVTSKKSCAYIQLGEHEDVGKIQSIAGEIKDLAGGPGKLWVAPFEDLVLK